MDAHGGNALVQYGSNTVTTGCHNSGARAEAAGRVVFIVEHMPTQIESVTVCPRILQHAGFGADAGEVKFLQLEAVELEQLLDRVPLVTFGADSKADQPQP